MVREIDPDGRNGIVNGELYAGGTDPAVIDRFVFDGQDIVLQFDGTGALAHRYLHGPMVDQVLSDERFTPSSAGQQPSSPGTVLYPLTDHQNTTRDLVNTSGTVVNHLTYDSFGKVTAETNAAVDYLFGYAGMERDEAINLDRADHRFYDPGMQRWLTEDPIGFGGGDYNVRRYVGNGPTNGTDPSGLEWSMFGQRWAWPWESSASLNPLKAVRLYAKSTGHVVTSGVSGAAGGATTGGLTAGGMAAAINPPAIGPAGLAGMGAGGSIGLLKGIWNSARSGPETGYGAIASKSFKDGLILGADSGPAAGMMGAGTGTRQPQPQSCPSPSGRSGGGTPIKPTPPPSGPTLYSTPSGHLIQAPPGYVGVTAQNGKGLVLLPKGQALGNNSNIIRYGEPTAQYPKGYFRYYNQHGQPLNPLTGKPGTQAETHIPIDYQGPLIGFPK